MNEAKKSRKLFKHVVAPFFMGVNLPSTTAKRV